MAAIAVGVWLCIVSFLVGGHVSATSKHKIKFVKQDIRTIQTDNAK